ncbi:MAG: hypothetical protein A3F26_01980 [Candidatus Ryanbacteria bacterium RIFCSPHIGHO2_12_FULL_47_12b]|uniref:Uncharacterized protein n=2 Tax=Candidatus Ryaniibacteriota TaxID=1817914 RepID=A0A1G2H4Q4_9BACT|nr:MAG: hypothetical protein UY14_C0002G0012 [Parcubacteria group bacterium GW2011_GWA1_47_9]OGZ47288.1 MAG: hypothetical protein A2844_02575 [Candidatus Ryanbacteria bacterium RIFCSPHIGHO2_01_FULL_48_80]OGZ49374.1 MAG: hypothetical protein A3C83_00765 [Candidatus Ryanbacteria bacterium RIFCSPHIGHO2_02_FULL_47_25]OGZ52475.1 MAG: hypothetical protein A3A29_01785 [Candidatus Ryanbacteria bacterium RIFCSPLOWO2_01_FULL_47_79]OGZ53261.1 MAG: hypothetical protein A3F26_01980 [Candidatus Ryanbacteria 
MKSKLFVSLAVFLAIAAAYRFMQNRNISGRLDIIYQNPNAIARHFSPTWRSIKKISDFYYLPRTIFHASNLPTYRLTLSRKDMQTLLNSLPQLVGGKPLLAEEGKDTVLGRFQYGTVDAEVRVRNRGLLPNHWSAIKKSWNINFTNSTTLDGHASLRLFIPEDRRWASEFLEAHRAKKFGVLTPDLEFVKLIMNGKNFGVYLSIENWEPAFFEQKKRAIGEIFAETDQEHPEDIFRLDAIDKWQRRINPLDTSNDAALAYFLYVVSETSDEEFARRIPAILDMDAYYGWALESLVARNRHSKNTGNLNFYFDPSRGMFEPIAYDMFSWELGDTFEVAHNRLLNRIMSHEPFRKEFEKRARAYVKDAANLEDDLAVYDQTTKSIEKDIMADSAKLPPTYEFFRAYREHRGHIITNFEKITRWFDERGELPLLFAEETYPLGGANRSTYDFSSFDAISATPEEFRASYPQFYSLGSNKIGIGPGKILFRKNIIVPKGFILIIQPGTEIFMDENVSFISYSPIEARGKQDSPIVIRAASTWVPWGTFALVDTPQESVFTHTQLSGGSSAVVNGMTFPPSTISAFDSILSK